MTRARRPFQTDRLRALVASGRLWLVELMAWLASVLGVAPQVRLELNAELDDLHRAVALLVFTEARRTLVTPGGPPHRSRPLSAPRGFVRGRESSEMRLLWRSVRRGVGLKNRIAALQSAIDDIPRLAARFLRRLNTPYRRALVLAQAQVDPLCAHACPPTLPWDSS